jgi:predicted aldo/keto reductase-like oxidoreductase
MLYREYGNTGKKLSILGFGGMRFRNIDDTGTCVRMMVEAASAGVNYFDTAPAYMGTKSESVFGEGFRELRKRGLAFYCATKTVKADESSIRRELDEQLRRLGVDCIDFYHVWCITSLADWKQRRKEGVLATFRRLKEEGLIKHICVSSHLIGDDIKNLLMEGVFEGVLFGYSAYNFNMRRAAFDAIRSRGIGCVVMNPLGGGIIPRNPEIFRFVKTRNDETVVEGALRFIFSHEHITTALVGFGERKEIQEAVRAVEGYRKMTTEEIEGIEKNIRESFDRLCTGCQYCDHCPESIPVPKFMDAFNLRLLYGSREKLLNRLKWHWEVPAADAERCTGCGKCEELCTQHLPIIDRLKEIAATARKSKV